MNSLISDYAELSYFLDIIPDLINDEVYFLSLASRKKYLTEAQRRLYDIGGHEMFARTIAKSKQGIIRALDLMDGERGAKKTKEGHPFPLHSIVVYFNLSPTSTVRAYNAYREKMDDATTRLLGSLLNHVDPDFTMFRDSQRHLMTEMQRAHARKPFIDIDVDVPVKDDLDDVKHEATELLVEQDIPHTIVNTQGGFHVLIRTKSLKNNGSFELHEYVNRLAEMTDKMEGGEAKFNQSKMIPLPGTFQANTPVTFKNII